MLLRVYAILLLMAGAALGQTPNQTILELVPRTSPPTFVGPANPLPTATTPSATTTTVTPTVQNASYVSGNCIGGFQAVPLAAANGGAADPTAVTVRSVSGRTPSLTVYVFSANPSGSTCTDKGTFTLASADVAKVITSFSVTLVAPTGATASLARQSFSPPLIANAAAGTTNLYTALVSGSTFTPGSATDIQETVEALH